MKFLRAAGTNETDFPSAGRPFLSGILIFSCSPWSNFHTQKEGTQLVFWVCRCICYLPRW